MSKRCLVLSAAFTAVVLVLASAGPARAQYTSGVPMDARGPYTNTYIAPWYVPPYDARITWPAPYARYSPILMTSINYPGVYGAYTMSTEALDYRGPTQFVDRYAPLTARLETIRLPERVVEDVALIDVRLPAAAELFFQGARMSSLGSYRRFVTPPLRGDQSYNYNVRATWTENGKPVTQERHVRVTPGDRLTIDFTEPPPIERGTPSSGSPTFELQSLPRR
jgi:uncharacterized protein (TIGR03000 family)